MDTSGPNPVNPWHPVASGSGKWDLDSVSESSARMQYRDGPKVSAEAQEAELIANATSQAIIAARSIVLSGGTQATALSTAKAAAESILLPNSQNLVATANFIRRRKAKRQASIIASMALGSVNNNLQQDFASRSRSDTFSYSQNSSHDVSRMIPQGSVPSYFRHDNDLFPLSPSSHMSSVKGMSAPCDLTSFPHPPVVSNTRSESQPASTMQSVAVGQTGTKDLSTISTEAKKIVAPATSETDSKGQNIGKTRITFESHSAVANILNGLASMSEIGSSNSNQLVQESMSGKKLPTEMPINRPKSKDFTYNFPEEDPIYDKQQKSLTKPENKPYQVSKRMAKFLKSTDSNEDSYTSEGSAKFSRDSTLFQSLESGMDETGSVDSGTAESLGSFTYDDRDGTRKGLDGESVFGIGAATVFSTIAENFFCSPYPKVSGMQPVLRENTDQRDEVEPHSSPPTTTSTRFLERLNSLGSKSRGRNPINMDDDDPLPNTAGDDKKNIHYETMEQLVLRALTGTPSPLLLGGSSTDSQTYNSAKRERSKNINESMEGKGASVVEPGTVCESTGSKSPKSSAHQLSRRIRLPIKWVRDKMNDRILTNQGAE